MNLLERSSTGHGSDLALGIYELDDLVVLGRGEDFAIGAVIGLAVVRIVAAGIAVAT